MTPRATSADVARHVGVSRSAVSLVLNGKADGLVSQAKQQAVLAAAKELDYRPNSIAMSLKTQRTRTIGVVTDNIATAGFGGQLLESASRTALTEDIFLLLADAGGDEDRIAPAFDMLLERQVDAVMFAAQSFRPFTFPDAAGDRPLVLAHAQDPRGTTPSVVPDEEAGGRAAVRALLDAGHRDVLMLRGGLEDPLAAGLRTQGFLTEMRAHGLQPREPIVAGWQISEGFAAASTVLGAPDRPTGIVCANDRVAVGVMLAANQMGLRVPQDLSIVGYDDDRNLAPQMVPALTTVRIPFEELGERAMRILLDGALTHAPMPAKTLVECPLVERESVAAPS